MKKILRLMGVLVVAGWFTGCAVTPAVFVDFDQSQSFQSYRTFAWIGDDPMIVTGDRGPNPFVAARLKGAIKDTIEGKGFQFVASPSDADFVVAYTVGARDKIDVREREVVDYYGPHWRWGYDYFGVVRPRGFPRTEVTTRQYAEGSLSIDIFDAKRKSPVWHGSGSKRLTRAELQGQSAESTRGAVQTILAEFPPQ